MFVEKRGQIFFFLKNYNVIVMEVNNFKKLKMLKNVNAKEMGEGYMDNYIHLGIKIKLSEVNTLHLFSTFKGETMVTDFQGDRVRYLNNP